MEMSRQEEIQKKAIAMVREAHASLREFPLKATYKNGIRKDVLLGMRFTVSNIDFVNNVVTFSLIE